MKLALSSWSLHEQFLNSPLTGMNAEQFIRSARHDFGIGFVEFYEADYTSSASTDFLADSIDLAFAARIHDECERHNVKIVCISAINDLATDRHKDADADIERISKWADHCAVLECPVIRINTGSQSLTPETVDLFVERLKRTADFVSDRNVILAIENHPRPLMSDRDTDLLIDLIKKVDCENVRACPDVVQWDPDTGRGRCRNWRLSRLTFI